MKIRILFYSLALAAIGFGYGWADALEKARSVGRGDLLIIPTIATAGYLILLAGHYRQVKHDEKLKSLTLASAIFFLIVVLSFLRRIASLL